MPDNVPPKSAAPPRRHRGRRGGRGRGRGPRPPAIPTAAGEPPAIPAAIEAPRPEPPEPPALLATVAAKVGRMAREPDAEIKGSALGQAIEQISEIVESLKRVLDQMEEVLELTELAERQKHGDEREIDSLRRALRQLQHPRIARSREDEHHESRPPEELH